MTVSDSTWLYAMSLPSTQGRIWLQSPTHSPKNELPCVQWDFYLSKHVKSCTVYLICVKDLQEGSIDFWVVKKPGLDLVHITDGIIELNRVWFQWHLQLVILASHLLPEVLWTITMIVCVLLAIVEHQATARKGALNWLEGHLEEMKVN